MGLLKKEQEKHLRRRIFSASVNMHLICFKKKGEVDGNKGQDVAEVGEHKAWVHHLYHKFLVSIYFILLIFLFISHTSLVRIR